MLVKSIIIMKLIVVIDVWVCVHVSVCLCVCVHIYLQLRDIIYIHNLLKHKHDNRKIGFLTVGNLYRIRFSGKTKVFYTFQNFHTIRIPLSLPDIMREISRTCRTLNLVLV